TPELTINLTSMLLGCSPDFFIQAEDGIRDFHVTGVQTCALPIYVQGPVHPHEDTAQADRQAENRHENRERSRPARLRSDEEEGQIGRASCRERVWTTEVTVSANKKTELMAWRRADRGAAERSGPS